MKSAFRFSIFGAIMALIAMPALSRAAIIVVAPTALSGGSLEITEDVVFTINDFGPGMYFVLDDWVAGYPSPTTTSYLPAMLISINGAPTISSPGTFTDNGAAAPDINYDDGLIHYTDTFDVTFGDTVTLKAGTYILESESGFNPQATQTFTGNMFIANDFGARISDVVAVPEPTVTGLLIGGAALAVVARRRKVS